MAKSFTDNCDDVIHNYQKIKMSRAKAVEPKVLQKYKMNKISVIIACCRVLLRMD